MTVERDKLQALGKYVNGNRRKGRLAHADATTVSEVRYCIDIAAGQIRISIDAGVSMAACRLTLAQARAFRAALEETIGRGEVIGLQ